MTNGGGGHGGNGGGGGGSGSGGGDVEEAAPIRGRGRRVVMVVGRAMAAAMAVAMAAATPMATMAVAVAVAVAVALVMAVAVAVAAAVAVVVVIPTPLRLQQPTVVLEGGWRGNACQVLKNTGWCLAPKGSSAFGIRVTGIRPSPQKRVKWWWWCRGGKCCVGAHIPLAAPNTHCGIEGGYGERTTTAHATAFEGSRVRGFGGSRFDSRGPHPFL